jgi:arsenate reductase
MAEGLLREFAGDSFEVASAGTVATRVRDEAVAVMREIGIDISNQESKTLDRYLYERFDLVVTVCDHARDTCPTFPNAVRRMHWSIPDPTAVPIRAGAATSGEPDFDRMPAFRAAREDLEGRIRDQILGAGVASGTPADSKRERGAP